MSVAPAPPSGELSRRYHLAPRAAIVCLYIAAFFLPLSEGIAQGALLAALALSLAAGRPRPCDQSRSPSLPALAITVGFVGWVWIGTLSLLVGGVLVRSSSLNKALLAVAVFLGMFVARRVTDAHLEKLLLCLMGGTFVAALAGLWQIRLGPLPFEHLFNDERRGIMGQLYAPGTSQRAATGTLRNRMKTAEMLVFVGAALATARLFAKDVYHRRLATLGGVFVLLMLALTYTKASLAAVAFAGVATLTLERSPRMRRWLWPGLALGLCVATIGAVYSGAVLVHTDKPLANDMWTTRRFIWHRAVAIIHDHFWLGTGIGGYSRVAPAYFFDPRSQLAFTLNAHSQHLTALAETGVFGFVFWVLLCAGIGVALYQSWRRPLVGRERSLRHLATFYLLSLAPMSLVHDVLFHPVTALLAWTCVGLLTVGSCSTPWSYGHQSCED